MEFEYSPGSITEFRDSFSTRANWQTWQDPYPRKLASPVEFIPQFIVAASPFNFSKKLPESFSNFSREREEEEWVLRFFDPELGLQ